MLTPAAPTRLNLLSLALLTAFTTTAHGSGYALIEQNASGLGNAYAGQAASAQDASTVFFNPAGLTKIKGTQWVVAGHAIVPSSKFHDSGSTISALGVTHTPTGGEGGDIGGLAIAPNLYYVQDLTQNLKFGIGFNAPFGLGTEYDPDWVGRFQAIKSEIKTININPSLGYKLNDKVSLGAGLDIMAIEATLTQLANYSYAIRSVGGNPVDNLSGLGSMHGDDWGYGYNLGILFEPTSGSRIGLNYRSRVSMTLQGDVAYQDVPDFTSGAYNVPVGFVAPLNAKFANGPITAKVTLPDSFSASVFKKLNDRVDLLADITWTNWSLFRELKVDRTSGANVSTTPENWKDTWRYSVGLNYRQNDKFTWRGGIAFDQSPVPDAFRTPRIPDEDRTWLALGLQYTLDDKSRVDVGYAHLFVKDPTINSTATGQGIISGTYSNHVDILSIQYTRNF